MHKQTLKGKYKIIQKRAQSDPKNTNTKSNHLINIISESPWTEKLRKTHEQNQQDQRKISSRKDMGMSDWPTTPDPPEPSVMGTQLGLFLRWDLMKFWAGLGRTVGEWWIENLGKEGRRRRSGNKEGKKNPGTKRAFDRFIRDGQGFFWNKSGAVCNFNFFFEDRDYIIANWCLFVFPIFMFELFWVGVTILQPKSKKKNPTKPNGSVRLVLFFFLNVHESLYETKCWFTSWFNFL